MSAVIGVEEEEGEEEEEEEQACLPSAECHRDPFLKRHRRLIVARKIRIDDDRDGGAQ